MISKLSEIAASLVRDNRKDKCPICHMDLARRHKGAAESQPLPPGTVSRVQLSPYRVVLAGVQSSSSINVVLSVQAIARAAGAIVTYPFLAALSVAIYANLRAAKEGVSPEGLLPVG